MKWLKEFFQRPPVGADERSSLPDDLLAALRSRRYDLITPAVRAWRTAQAQGPKPDTLLDAARAFGWGGRELDKLEVLAEYYFGDVNRAFERARPYTMGDQFDPDLYVICAVALFQNGQFDDAHRFLRQADAHAALVHDHADYWMMRALICWAANDMIALPAAVDRMCALSPDDPTALENASAMYLELGDMQAFHRTRARMAEDGLRPGYAYSLNTLALGDYAQGFRQMEARYEMEEARRYLNPALLSLSRWRAEPLAGRTLLVSAEQGLGDTIQMARYLPGLIGLGMGRVVMETQPETLTLLQYNFPDLPMAASEFGKLPPLDFDLWIGTMSLPQLFGTTTENVPGVSGYLGVPPDNAVYWRKRVSEISDGNRLRIGLAWSGLPAHRADRRRSVPIPVMMDAISGIDAVFFALQTQVAAEHPANLIEVFEELVTLADTAALIAEMDLVITVDTSVVHVAGAIGKETWLLLPYRYEWRWGLEGEDNHWYDSVRVLRQRSHGDWAGLLDDVFCRRLPMRRRQ
jgi:tetratricopeptide (TPR) repeat protein